MGGLKNIEAVYIALVFVVPGYIFLTLRNQFVAGQDRLGTEQILGFVAYSSINFALFGWMIYLAIAYEVDPLPRVAIWILTLVVIPAAIGLLCGVCSQKEIVGRIYRIFRLNPIHPTPRAWERVFFNSPASWVLVTLKNDIQFAGWWGGESFASSDAKERDLYISQIFEFDGDKPWRPTGKGLFIAAGEVRTIEFIPVERLIENDGHP
jgi:hypothetical protein